MALRPICEPVELPLGATVLAERVEHADTSPEFGRLLHFHDLCEIVLFEQVAGDFIADGRRRPIGDGSLVFIPSMRRHDFALAPGRKIWRLVQIDPYAVERAALAPGGARLTRSFVALPDDALRARLAMLADWLVDVTAEGHDDPMIGRIVELLLLALLDAPEEKTAMGDDESPQADRLLPALERLRRDPAAPLTMEAAASACSLSPAYFSRRFKQVLGMSFTDYTRAYRLDLAARRILSTRASIAEIAYGLGFASPSHFGARFHERFGMTPRAYRAGTHRRSTA